MSKLVDIWGYASRDGGVSISIGSQHLAIARWIASEIEDLSKTTGDKKEKIAWLEASCHLDEIIAEAEANKAMLEESQGDGKESE